MMIVSALLLYKSMRKWDAQYIQTMLGPIARCEETGCDSYRLPRSLWCEAHKPIDDKT